MDRDLGSVLIFIANYLLHQASSALPLKLAKSSLSDIWELKNQKDFLTIVTEMMLQLIAISREKNNWIIVHLYFFFSMYSHKCFNWMFACFAGFVDAGMGFIKQSIHLAEQQDKNSFTTNIV